MTAVVPLDDLPGIPRDSEGPVFAAPWQAQAFAMTVRMHERGCFSWTEWAMTLAEEIKRAQAAGDPDCGDTYWNHWLAALEQLTTAKGVVGPAELEGRREAWRRAAEAAPHGEPITLDRIARGGA